MSSLRIFKIFDKIETHMGYKKNGKNSNWNLKFLVKMRSFLLDQ